MNPAAAGTVYPAVRFTLEPERVEAFRTLFGQTDGVPPTFLTAAESVVFPQVLGDPALDLDFSRVVHGGQEYEYRRPLVEGDGLSVRAWIESIRSRGDTGFLIVAMEMTDDDGAVVATSRSTLIERGTG